MRQERISRSIFNDILRMNKNNNDKFFVIVKAKVNKQGRSQLTLCNRFVSHSDNCNINDRMKNYKTVTVMDEDFEKDSLFSTIYEDTLVSSTEKFTVT